MTDQTVSVYVRLCDQQRPDCRDISFRIPEGITQAEVLEWGYAIDGNQALKRLADALEITDHKHVESQDGYVDEDGEFVPESQPETGCMVTTALYDEEVALAKRFDEKGYTVKWE